MGAFCKQRNFTINRLFIRVYQIKREKTKEMVDSINFFSDCPYSSFLNYIMTIHVHLYKSF